MNNPIRTRIALVEIVRPQRTPLDYATTTRRRDVARYTQWDRMNRLALVAGCIGVALIVGIAIIG